MFAGVVSHWLVAVANFIAKYLRELKECKYVHKLGRRNFHDSFMRWLADCIFAK